MIIYISNLFFPLVIPIENSLEERLENI